MPCPSCTAKSSRINLMQSSYGEDLNLKTILINYLNEKSSLITDSAIVNRSQFLTDSANSSYHMLVRRFMRGYPLPKKPRNLLLSLRGQRIIIMMRSNDQVKAIQLCPWMLYLQNNAKMSQSKTLYFHHK